MSDAARLAWMLIYLSTCIDYIKENNPEVYNNSGLPDFEKEFEKLEPIIQKFKDEKA